MPNEVAHLPIPDNIVRTYEYLSEGALVPVIGTIPAIVKIVLAIIHTLVAICSLPFSSNANNHLKYAIRNIAIGFGEAIPFIGTVVAFTELVKRVSLRM